MFQIRSLAASVLLALAATLAFSLSSSAQDEAPEARVARLVRELGSRSYSVRNRAAEELELVGAQSREQLKAAARSDNDEVRLAARRLLRRLDVEELWSASEVSLYARNALASEVIARLAEQSGNSLQGGDLYGPFENGRITLALDRVPFWQALHEVCRASGNHARRQYDARQRGLVLVAGPPGEHPLAWSGPVQAQVVSARRVFIEDLDYERGHSDVSHSLVLNLRMTWEDRFAPSAYRTELEFVEAIGAGDETLSAAGAAASDWKAASRTTRDVALSLRLRPPPSGTSRLDVLRVQWGLATAGNLQSLEVRDWSAGKVYAQDDVRLEVAASQVEQDGRVRLTLLVQRELPPPQVREVLFEENTFDLVDAEGRLFRKQVLDRKLTEEGLRIEVSFSPDSACGGADLLRFSYPGFRSQRALEFVFRDVPLPAAKAE